MSIKDYYASENFNFETSDFSKVGYQLKSLKWKFRNDNIIKISVKFDIEYIENK